MSDIEEEQPTQDRKRNSWGKAKPKVPMTGDDRLDGDAPLVPTAETVGEAHKGKLDGNPGGTLMREGDDED
jgi:hypothetical protein